MADEKKCTKCKQVKPLTAFHKDRSKVDGRRSICAECTKRYATSIQQNRTAYQRAYRRSRRRREGLARASWGETWAAFALVMAERSRCSRSKIGAVIVSPENRVVATGYNGPPARWRPNGKMLTASCKDWCDRGRIEIELGVKHPPPELDKLYEDCPANHAEINALMHSSRSEREGGTLFVTGSVCYGCAKAVANSGISIVVLVNVDEAADAHRNPDKVRTFLQRCGLTVHQATLE